MMPTIYAAALNFRGTYAALESLMHTPPYSAPPRAPVLYIKPAHCRIPSGAEIPCPPDVSALRMGGTLALIIGRTARGVAEHDAFRYIGACAIGNDVSVPEQSYFRPAIKQRCRDGFCPLSEPVTIGQQGWDPDALRIRISVNGAQALEISTSEMRRSVSRLIADITEFMTLSPGDILLVGEPPAAPEARPGDTVCVEIGGLGSLTNRVVLEANL